MKKGKKNNNNVINELRIRYFMDLLKLLTFNVTIWIIKESGSCSRFFLQWDAWYLTPKSENSMSLLIFLKQRKAIPLPPNKNSFE